MAKFEKRSIPWSGHVGTRPRWSWSAQCAMQAGLLPPSLLVKELRQRPDWAELCASAGGKITAAWIEAEIPASEHHHHQMRAGRPGVQLVGFYDPAEAAAAILHMGHDDLVPGCDECEALAVLSLKYDLTMAQGARAAGDEARAIRLETRFAQARALAT